jgi:hypothetical protein
MSMTDIVREHARLIILRDLAEQVDLQWHSMFLWEDLRLRWNIKKPIEWIHGELRWLEMMGAVTLVPAGEGLIAKITRKGRDHLDHLALIEGVKRPDDGI